MSLHAAILTALQTGFGQRTLPSVFRVRPVFGPDFCFLTFSHSSFNEFSLSPHSFGAAQSAPFPFFKRIPVLLMSTLHFFILLISTCAKLKKIKNDFGDCFCFLLLCSASSFPHTIYM